MKLLIIGGGGQLGSKIIESTNDEHELYGTYLTRKPNLTSNNCFKLNKTSKSDIRKVMKQIEPDVVIDTAALHNVGYCEIHRDEADSINHIGTKNVAENCRKIGAKMVFISTDYVFDGEKGLYKEEDTPNPVNYYGYSKLQGEVAVQETCEDYIIARPSVIYSWLSSSEIESSSGKPLNFAMWLTQKFGNNEPVTIVTDQYSSPTLANNLADILLTMCKNDITGLYHIAGNTRLNRYDFTMKFAEKMGYDQSLISPILSSHFKQNAKRPMDSSLDMSKVERTLNIKTLDIDQALDIFKKQALGE